MTRGRPRDRVLGCGMILRFEELLRFSIVPYFYPTSLKVLERKRVARLNCHGASTTVHHLLWISPKGLWNEAAWLSYSLTQSTGPVSVPRCRTRFDRERASLSRQMPSLVGCDACNSVLHRTVNKGRLRNQLGCGFFLEMISSRPPRVDAPPSTRPFSQTSFTTAYMYVYI